METLTTKTMTRNYVLALGLLAALSLAAFGLLQLIISTQETSAKSINVSGRQRMLSQRIAFFSLKMIDEPAGPEQERVRRELNKSVALMARSHRQLRDGDAEAGIAPPSAENQKLFNGPSPNVDAGVKRYLMHARALAKAPAEELDDDNPDLKAVSELATGALLVDLDEVVRQYQAESELVIANLERLIVILILIILIVLLGEAQLIFRPMISRIGQQTEELEGLYSQANKIATTLQKNLLPSRPPDIKGLAFAYVYESATRSASVGGDFYDYYKNDDGSWTIILADVSGHGIAAASEIARVKHLLRDRAVAGLKPTEILSSVNQSLAEQHAERFTALTYMNYNLSTGIISMIAAGNPYPYLLIEDRFIELAGVPLSIVEDEKYTAVDIELKHGETLILFTDGLTEARVGASLFGSERLRNSFRANASFPPEEMLRNVVDDAKTFARGHLSDDLLMISLTRR